MDEGEGWLRATTRLVNVHGLHARPSTMIVQEANRFQSQVELTIEGRSANGKSIMEVMMLASPVGTEVEVATLGVDATEALAALLEVIASGFGEKPR